MSRELSKYVSMMKINGHPILPPLVNEADRPLLRRHREEAVRIEVALAERKRQKELEQEAKPVDKMSDSMVSNIDSEQVMNFICQALKDSSHLEEVQQLQLAIFEELQKYQGNSPSYREDDSMDTMHNIDDFSNTAGSSREVSPTKSLPSEKFPSPPKIAPEHLNVPSAAFQISAASQIKAVEGWRNGEDRMNRSDVLSSTVLADLVEPRMSLSYPSTPLNDSRSSGHVDSPSVADPGKSSDVSPDHNGGSGSKTPPRLIRRNSYTLESPSPSVLLYLKNLSVNDSVMTASSDRAAKRNLNQVWSEVLLQPVDARTATPMDLSAASWRSESNTPSVSEHSSVLRNQTPRLNDNTTSIRSNLEVLNNNVPPQDSKKSYEHNSRSLDIHKAAAKIQAGVRGYLTRRLLKTGRVLELKNAIRDSLITALQMHTETTVSKAELELHRRLTLQIESLCDEWHQIFFEYSPQERMRIIQVDRNKPKNPKPKKPFLKKSKSRTSMESSGSSIEKSSVASRPKSLPLTKPSHSSTVNYQPWK